MSSVVPGPSVLVAQLRACRTRVASFEPERYESADCAALAEELAALENSCSVAAVRAAKRAASCGEHHARGHADEHDWLAKLSGTTSAAARDALRTIESLDDCPETRDALLCGDVSLPQASEIVRAEREVPGSEHELLETARTHSLGAVREQARKRRLDAIEPEQRRARQHAAREVKHWTDDLGMVAGTFRIEPVAGAQFVKHLERATDRHWRAAHRDGRNESRAALAADAFVELFGADRDHEASDDVSDGASPNQTPRRRKPSTNADVVIVQSAESMRRGYPRPGERCHVVGGGPIAPSEVEELIAAGAFVKAVLHNGKQVTHVAHYGRNLTAEMRTALGLGPPPDFDGLRCSEDGCERRLGLEIDHLDPVANGGPTSLENLNPKCSIHHEAKTRRDRAAGLFDQGP
jgi:hypothetical protein